eukprot:c18612_g1_i1 orf=321-1394(+)
MERKIWSSMPDCLLERTLAMLPIPCLLRLRSVCRAWNASILSSSFLKLYSSLSSQRTHYLLVTTLDAKCPLLVFDPIREKWHAPSLSFLPINTEFSLVTAAGGLLCLSDGKDFIFCNPVTRKWRKIPSLPEGRSFVNIILLGMVTSRDLKNGKLLMLDSTDCCRQATYLYDFVGQSWKCSDAVEEEFFESNGVFHGENFYVVCSFPPRVRVFNTRNSTWVSHPAPLPHGMVNPSLVPSCGRLLMLAIVDAIRQGITIQSCRFQIWLLNEEAQIWEEFDCMPKTVCQNFFKSKEYLDGFSCAAYDNLIYLTSYHGSPTVVFDICKRSWRWLPVCGTLANHSVCINDIFVLEPLLNMVL